MEVAGTTVGLAQKGVAEALKHYQKDRGCIIKVHNRLPGKTLGGIKDAETQNHPTFHIKTGGSKEPVEPPILKPGQAGVWTVINRTMSLSGTDGYICYPIICGAAGAEESLLIYWNVAGPEQDSNCLARAISGVMGKKSDADRGSHWAARIMTHQEAAASYTTSNDAGGRADHERIIQELWDGRQHCTPTGVPAEVQKALGVTGSKAAAAKYQVAATMIRHNHMYVIDLYIAPAAGTGQPKLEP